MKKVPNITITTQYVNTQTLSCYELNDTHYVASYLNYMRTTEYFGQRDIYVWKTFWAVIDRNSFALVTRSNSRKKAIERFNELAQKMEM